MAVGREAPRGKRTVWLRTAPAEKTQECQSRPGSVTQVTGDGPFPVSERLPYRGIRKPPIPKQFPGFLVPEPSIRRRSGTGQDPPGGIPGLSGSFRDPPYRVQETSNRRRRHESPGFGWPALDFRPLIGRGRNMVNCPPPVKGFIINRHGQQWVPHPCRPSGSSGHAGMFQRPGWQFHPGRLGLPVDSGRSPPLLPCFGKGVIP